MSLYEDWVKKAFDKNGRSIDAVWDIYLPKEQKIYEEILEGKITKIEGTIKELAEKYSMDTQQAVAFVDGINEVLPTPYDINELTEDSKVELNIDFEKLYKKMVEYKAKHLYSLSQWDNIFTEDERKRFTHEQKLSGTVIKGKKILWGLTTRHTRLQRQ